MSAPPPPSSGPSQVARSPPLPRCGPPPTIASPPPPPRQCSSPTRSSAAVAPSSPSVSAHRPPCSPRPARHHRCHPHGHGSPPFAVLCSSSTFFTVVVTGNSGHPATARPPLRNIPHNWNDRRPGIRHPCRPVVLVPNPVPPFRPLFCAPPPQLWDRLPWVAPSAEDGGASDGDGDGSPPSLRLDLRGGRMERSQARIPVSSMLCVIGIPAMPTRVPGRNSRASFLWRCSTPDPCPSLLWASGTQRGASGPACAAGFSREVLYINLRKL